MYQLLDQFDVSQRTLITPVDVLRTKGTQVGYKPALCEPKSKYAFTTDALISQRSKRRVQNRTALGIDSVRSRAGLGQDSKPLHLDGPGQSRESPISTVFVIFYC